MEWNGLTRGGILSQQDLHRKGVEDGICSLEAAMTSGVRLVCLQIRVTAEYQDLPTLQKCATFTVVMP